MKGFEVIVTKLHVIFAFKILFYTRASKMEIPIQTLDNGETYAIKL
jgi:hypothetical protein